MGSFDVEVPEYVEEGAKTAHKAIYGALVWFATLCASGLEHMAGADWWAYPLTVVLGGALGTTVVYQTKNKLKS